MEEVKHVGRPRKLDKPKKRFTLYLTDEAVSKFNELYAFRVVRGTKDSKSDVWCDAIRVLHASEFDNIK